MDLDAYLQRINYEGSLEPSFATLRDLHSAHLLRIPYENLDIHLGRALILDKQAIFQKLVTEQRGGWCFEMNGLFAWVLQKLGFDVSLLAGAVNRVQQGAMTKFGHLLLLIQLDRAYLADVGFGNGFLEPLPLIEGKHVQGFLEFCLERLDANWWRFHNHKHGGPSFDFSLEPYELSDFAAKCHELQSSPESGFVRLTVCHRFTPEGIVSLRGAQLQKVKATGFQEETITDFAHYQKVITEDFGLTLELEPLWEKVWQSHLVWQASLKHA